MKTAYHTYRTSDSDSLESHWPRSVSIATLSMALIAVFNAYLQLVTLLSGASIAFVALITGLLGLGVGLWLGARYFSSVRPVFQRSFAIVLLLQSATIYLLNRQYGLLLSTESALFVIGTLFLNTLATGTLFEGALGTSRTLNGSQFSLSLVIGAGIGVGLETATPFAFSAPVLLSMAGGALLMTAGLTVADDTLNANQPTKDNTKVRLALLALMGIFTLAIIAQVMVKREELHALSAVSARNNLPTANLAAKHIFWAYGSELPPQAFAQNGLPENHTNDYRLMAGLFDDSLSILLTDGAMAELNGIRALNCATVTTIKIGRAHV